MAEYEIIKMDDKGELLVYWNESGNIETIPANKFKDGEFVQTSKKHFSPKDFTRVQSPTYTKNRGWVYVENFCDKNGKGGGCCAWNEEGLYEKLSDPLNILIAKKLTLKKRISEIETQKKNIDNELSSIEYALGLILVGSIN